MSTVKKLLTTPQARILLALYELPKTSSLSYQQIQEELGCSKISGTITVALYGRSSCNIGLLKLGLVEMIPLSIEVGARMEKRYKITPLGKAALCEHLSHSKIPPKRGYSHTNNRYKGA